MKKIIEFCNNNTKKILLAIILLLIVITSGILIYTKKTAQNIENVNKNVQAKNDEKVDEKAKEEEQKSDNDIVDDGNTTVAGDKFADSGIELQDIIKHGKMTVDGTKKAYITFDDGPSTTVTPKILETLNNKGVKATFFIVGTAIEKSDKAKELLKTEIEQGNAIANHTYSHNYGTLYPGRHVNAHNFVEEIQKNNGIMKSVLGEKFNTKVVRFPGGHMSWKGTEEVDAKLKEMNESFIDWNALTGDAEGKKKSAPELVNKLKKEVNDKVKPDRLVILMHDTYGKEATAQALPEVIDYIKSLGYDFRTIK